MSEAEKNDFEKLLRESAEEFRVTPSEGMWDRIYGELHRPRRRAPLWWAAAAALLLGAGIYGLSRYTVKTDRLPGVREPEAQALSGNHAPAAPLRENAVPDAGDIAPASSSIAPPTGRSGGEAQSPQHTAYPVSAIASPVVSSLFPSTALPPRWAYSLPLASSAVSLPQVVGVPAVPLKKTGLLSGSAPASATSGVPDLAAAAPEEKPKAKVSARHRWSWGVFATPAIGYRVFETGAKHGGAVPSAMAPAPQNNAYFFNVLAVRRVGKITYAHDRQWNWSAGVRAYYNLSDKWTVQSGLSISQTGYAARVYEASPAYVTSDGTVTPEGRAAAVNSGTLSYADYAMTSQPKQYHNHYLALEIPVIFHRTFPTGGKISFDVGAGAGLSYLVASRSLVYSPPSGRYYADKHALRDLNYDLHFEAGVVIPAGRKMALTAGPAVQYQAGSTYRHYDLVREHPYFVGLQLGLKKIR